MLHARPDYARIQDPEHKIPEDEPVFLIRAKDRAAPETLRHWAALQCAIPDADPTLISAAITHAARMERWQDAHGCKTADSAPGHAATSVVTHEVFSLPESDGLDPILIFATIHSPTSVRLTVTCYDKSWTASFVSTGKPWQVFIRSLEPRYLAGALSRGSGKDDLGYLRRVARAVISSFQRKPSYFDSDEWEERLRAWKDPITKG